METGNKILSTPLFKKKIHLKADNEQETAQIGLLSFIDISRSGVQILKRNKAFKVIELIDYVFPFSSDNGVWNKNVLEVVGSADFQTHMAESESKFALSDSKVTAVPTSLFSESRKTETFQFLFEESNDDLVLNQALSNIDATGVFSLPKVLSESISGPIQSSYLDWIETLSTDSSRLKANLVLENKQFALIILKEGKLLLANWFAFEKANDVLYYLMASLESLKILHSEIDVVLSGEVDKGDDVHSAISKFISKLSFAKRPKNLTYSYSFKEIPEHRYPFIFASACA